MIGVTHDATLTILYEDVFRGDPRYGGLGVFVQVRHWRAPAGDDNVVHLAWRYSDDQPMQQHFEYEPDAAEAVRRALWLLKDHSTVLLMP
jgi:hypothetical protein